MMMDSRGATELSQLLQHAGEGGRQVLRIRGVERHGWPDLDDVVERSVGTEQDAEIAHPIGDVRRLRGSRLERLTILDEFDAEEQPRSPDVPDSRMVADERPQTSEHQITDLARVILQPLLFDDVQHREPDGAGDG